MAHEYAAQARGALDIFEDSPWKAALQDLAGYVVDRIS
jgi:geranylgeranyl pyrophosphate synthase